MSDGQEPDEPMRRPRGRHARKPAPVAGEGWRARIAAAAAPVVASVEPRIGTAAAWLYERRLHVLIVSATVATVVMIGGAVALISVAGGPRPAEEASTVVVGTRPTSSEPGEPGTYAPILPSPGPTPSIAPATPKPTPTPDGESDVPVTDEPVEPTAEPEPEPDEPRGNPNAPGQTKKPEKPNG